jgi:hypothetical protein
MPCIEWQFWREWMRESSLALVPSLPFPILFFKSKFKQTLSTPIHKHTWVTSIRCCNLRQKFVDKFSLYFSLSNYFIFLRPKHIFFTWKWKAPTSFVLFLFRFFCLVWNNLIFSTFFMSTFLRALKYLCFKWITSVLLSLKCTN